MKKLDIKQIREFIPGCTEIRECPTLKSCIKDNDRLCKDKDRPCYITYKKEELEGTIILDFKNNILAVHRLNENEDYVDITRPDGIGITLKGKEEKEKTKKILRSIR